MAGGCRLPKVIVVFALLLQINCARFDDLLDRVRLSKTNEPEVQDFLRSVLKHHSDFKWIGNEVRQNRNAFDTSANKNKRSFYSTNGAYPSPSRYGYRHSQDEETVNDKRNSNANRVETNDRPNPASDDIDFEGPVNDIYPYQDNLNAPEDHRFVRETQDSFLYDDNPQNSEYNFLDEAGLAFPSQLADDTTESGDFLEEDRVPDIRRGVTTEQLLNHKMFLHGMLDKNAQTQPDDLNRIGKQSQTWNVGNALPGDTIEVIPSSMKGIKYAPGVKYEKYSEYGKNDDEDQYEGGSHKVFKRKCQESLEDNDFKVPELFNNTKLDESAKAEFYYSLPHDILGINQDMSNEQKNIYNMTCKKLRRSVNWDQILPKSKGSKKKLKDIKIKIFDDGRMVKDIQKDDKGNSIVLRIRNPASASVSQRWRPDGQQYHNYLTPAVTNPATMEKDAESGSKYLTALNQYSINLMPKYHSSVKNTRLDANIKSSSSEDKDDDNTLEKIDSILKHDIASLKQKDLVNSISDVIAKHDNAFDFLQPSSRSPSLTSGTSMTQTQGPTYTGSVSKQVSYDKVKSMATMAKSFVDNNNDFGRTGAFNNNNNEQIKQNRLEDQTEPTSAAEQRELGKLNNNYYTRPMSNEITTEKIIIIPLKKSTVGASKIVQKKVVVQKVTKTPHQHHERRAEEEDSSFEEDFEGGRGVEEVIDQLKYNLDQQNYGVTKFLEDNDGEEEDHLEEESQEAFDKWKNDLLDGGSRVSRFAGNNKVNEQMKRSDEGQPKELLTLKADAFRSRKLFSYEEDKNVKEMDTNNDEVNDVKNEKDRRISILNLNDASGIYSLGHSEISNSNVKNYNGPEDTQLGTSQEEEYDQGLNGRLIRNPEDLETLQNTFLQENYDQDTGGNSNILFEDDDHQYLEDLEAQETHFNQRPKKDIRRFLGMQNDEDYSEDRNDVYGEDEKSKRKIERKTKFQKEKSKLGSLISSQEEKRAFRGRLAHTKSSKFKKDLTRENQYLANIRDPINEEELKNFNYDDLSDSLSIPKSDSDQDLLDQELDQDLEQYRLDNKNEVDSKISRKIFPKKYTKHHETSTKKEEEKDLFEQPEHTTKLGDRCCENSSEKSNTTISDNTTTENSKSEEKPKTSEDSPTPPKSPLTGEDFGNELDIIERTQAIMLHLTGKPPISGNKDNSTNRGNIDENDDPESKLQNEVDLTFKSPDNGKHTDNVVSEIIQLVQNYKDKVNEYKKNNHLDEVGSSSTKGCTSTILTSTGSTTMDEHIESKKNVRHHPKHVFLTKTTSGFKTRHDSSKVLSERGEDVGYHSHARMKAKKLHPLKESKCETKEGKDIQIHEKNFKSDQEFVNPLIIREGFVQPEVVADIPEKEVQSRSDQPMKDKTKSEDTVKKGTRSDDLVKSDSDEIRFDEKQLDVRSDDQTQNDDFQLDQNRPVDDFRLLDPKQIDIRSDPDQLDPFRSLSNPNEIQPSINQNDVISVKEDLIKTLQKRNQREQPDDNPMSFTPDNIESFKDIIELGKRKQRQQEMNDEDNEDDESVTGSSQDSRYKRDLEGDYADEEITKLLAMVNDASAHAQKDREEYKRYRRYKNYEPFYYESFPRQDKARQVSLEPGSTMKLVSTAESSTSASSGTTLKPAGSPSPSDKLICPIDECGGNINDDDLMGKKHKKKKHKCQYGDEYGDTSSGHSESRKMTKEQMTADQKTRQQTKDKIMRDKLIERQKEQEHIKNVLNGHLILDIMDKFHKKLKENSHLYDRFGQSLGKKCAADQVKFIDEFNTDQSKADVRHAQLMLHQVIVLMNKIVAEQVHRRTCLILSPTLRNYLKRIAVSKNSNPKSSIIAEGYPLPALKENKNTKTQSMDEKQPDFLFPDMTDEDHPQSPREMEMVIKKKINIIRSLLSKYQHMSHNCQVHVEPVRDYLVKQLKVLKKLERDKKFDQHEDICEGRMHEGKNQSSADGGTTTGTTVSAGADAKVSRAVVFDPYSDVYKYDEPKNGLGSEKYRKLVDAAANFRRKRQIEERLARLFGDKRNKRKNFESTTSRLEEKEDKEKDKENKEKEDDDDAEDQLRKVAFEAPMVYSLH